jgi:hypothetical protein
MTKAYKHFSVFYILVVCLSEVYVFRARVSKLGRGGALGIYVPKRVVKHIEHLHGHEVVVVVLTPLD